MHHQEEEKSEDSANPEVVEFSDAFI